MVSFSLAMTTRPDATSGSPYVFPSSGADVHAGAAGLRLVAVGSAPLPRPSWWYTGQLVPNTVWGTGPGDDAAPAEGSVATTTVPHATINALQARMPTGKEDDRRVGRVRLTRSTPPSSHPSWQTGAGSCTAFAPNRRTTCTARSDWIRADRAWIREDRARSEAFDDGAGGEGPAAAHRHECQVGVPTLELVQSSGDQAASGRAHGMADGDGAAVDVDLVPVDPVHLLPRAHHRGEGLVDLEDVDVVGRHPGFAEHLLGGGDGAVEVVVGIRPDEHLGHDARPGPQARGLGAVLGHPQHGGGAVGDLRRVPGGMDAVG